MDIEQAVQAAADENPHIDASDALVIAREILTIINQSGDVSQRLKDVYGRLSRCEIALIDVDLQTRVTQSLMSLESKSR